MSTKTVKVLCDGEEYDAPQDAWYTPPNYYGLIHCKVTEHGREQRLGIVRWHAFGFWWAIYAQRYDRTVQSKSRHSQKFHSDQEAMAYLDTYLAIAPERGEKK